MKRKELMLVLSLCLCLVMTTFTGCGSENTDSGETTGSTETVESTDDTEETGEDLILDGRAEVHYTKRDLAGTYDGGTEIALTGSQTITEEGVYIFSGTLDDGQIIVEADDAAKVQIVLNGVNLTCKDGPAIYVKSADKVFLTLADGTENTIKDGSSYSSTYTKEDEPWGAIFSKDDVTINGSGTLTVEGNYLHGISVKDSLKITGGTIEVTAKEDGMRGRDEISIHDGTITVTAAEDGLKSNNDEEEGRGNVTIDGGSVTIKGTASQGIDAYNVAQILGGDVRITTENEGIQGEHIYVKDGDLNIDAVDDCLNAKDSLIEDTEANHEDALLEIAGGSLVLSTSAGDGLDSNGSILVSGGTTIVHGSSGGVEVSMDYNGTGTITGGIVMATGASGMAQNFDNSSTQCSLLCNCSGNSGSTITLKDSDGNEILSFESENSFSSLLLSAPEMKTGETYTLSVGGSETTIELSDTITSYGGGGMGGMGGMGDMMDPGHGGGGDPGAMGQPGGPM